MVSTLASRQGDPGSNPRAARKSCEVYPGLGILQPQWNPYSTLPLIVVVVVEKQQQQHY